MLSFMGNYEGDAPSMAIYVCQLFTGTLLDGMTLKEFTIVQYNWRHMEG